LKEGVSGNLCFLYDSYTGTGKRKVERILQSEKNNLKLIGDRMVVSSNGQTRRPLTIEDLKLFIRVPKDSEIEEDITVDSTFMMDSIDEIGKSIRSSKYWVSRLTPIVFFMDNAGGHGKDEIKLKYVDILEKI
jgi:hypothetical protein